MPACQAKRACLTTGIYFGCRAAFFRGADPPPGGRLSTGRGVEQWQLARLITWRSQVQILSPQFSIRRVLEPRSPLLRGFCFVGASFQLAFAHRALKI